MAYAAFETEETGLQLPTAQSAPDELYEAGLAYSLGEGVELDLVEAHKWFNLAAARGHEAARDLRQEMAGQMSSEEVREAQKAAREWLRLMN